ncbi:MAG: molybdopterin molybdotransferase [Flavobacteriales bacterium]|jgi:molybdopterin molybdotransferase
MKGTINTEPSCADPTDPNSISVAHALSQIDAKTVALQQAVLLPIRECLGRICSESIRSNINVPGHANSAMDGYAIAFADLQADVREGHISTFEEIGCAFAGRRLDVVCKAGQCIRIMTGAVIPEGCDTVIMQEQAEQHEDGLIAVDSNHRLGENVRYAGEDIKHDSVILNQGDKISPADLGVLASLGIAELNVFRKPIVAFMSTGDELVAIDKPLGKGQIHDSNRYTLYGMLAQLEVDMIDLGVIQDDFDSIRSALLDAAKKADLIITTGGVSVGQADFIKTALEDIGQPDFWKIAIKPGRPLTFGKIEDSLFIGLPGNPVAVMVTFNHFVIPAIRKLSGAPSAQVPIVRAASTEKMRKRAGRLEIQRGIASLSEDGQWQVCKTGKQGSGILTSMTRGNCFILLREENNGVEIGDLIEIQLFDWSQV